MPAETCEHCAINCQFSFLEQAHFPGQALRRDIHKRHHLAVLKNMHYSWHRGKQNSIDEWSEVKQGEQCSREQGGGIEVDVPGNRVSVWMVGEPCVQVIQSLVNQEPQPVDQEGDNKVDPSPAPVYCQTSPCRIFLYRVLCFTFEIGTKCDKSEDWEKEKGRELKKETEYSFPASSCSMYGDQAQDNPKG